MVPKKTSRTPKTAAPATTNDSPAAAPRARRRQPESDAAPTAAQATPAPRKRSATLAADGVAATSKPRQARKNTAAAPPAAAAPTPDESPRVDVPMPTEATPLATPINAPAPAITDEDVRVRAYFLSLEHGGRGEAVDFWLLAERELRASIERD